MKNSTKRNKTSITVLLLCLISFGVATASTNFGQAPESSSQATAQNSYSSSILQLRNNHRSIIPVVLFFYPQQDTNLNNPLAPIADKNQEDHQNDTEPLQENSTPTWMKMIGAIVDIFLSVYNGI